MDDIKTLAMPEFAKPMAPSARQCLVATGLSKSFGAFRAVNDVSLRVDDGEVVALIGPNGAGKSTLFDLLTGRKKADTGNVTLFGEDITHLPTWDRARRGLGRSFQVSSVFSSFTVRENVQFAICLARGGAYAPFRAASRLHVEAADELLAKVGLVSDADRRADELSYGDQRALELAVTLALSPKILLLDEPTAGMGAQETDRCLERIRAIARSQNIPVLFVEHDMNVVFSFATRVIVLTAGKVLIDGEPEAVRSDERVREAYFGESI